MLLTPRIILVMNNLYFYHHRFGAFTVHIQFVFADKLDDWSDAMQDVCDKTVNTLLLSPCLISDYFCGDAYCCCGNVFRTWS